MRKLVWSLQAGERFYSIRALITQLEVSQLLIYKGLEHLQHENLLIVKPGGELFVTEDRKYIEHSKKPCVIVAVPDYNSLEVREFKKITEEINKSDATYRILLVEFPPYLSLPQNLPFDSEESVLGTIILLSGAELIPESIIALNKINAKTKLITIGQHLEDFGINSVGVDDNQVAMMAMEHLKQNGHKKVAVVFCDPHCRSLEIRCRSAVNYGKLQGIEVEIINCNIMAGENASIKTFDTIKNMFKQGIKMDFTAMVGLSGEQFVGAIEAFQQQNLSIPEDMSMVAISGEHIITAVNPPLDTVKVLSGQQLREALSIITLNRKLDFLGKYIEPELEIHNSVKKI